VDCGLAPFVAARAGGELRLDVADARSIIAALLPGDVIVDTAGPFQQRSTALVDAAIELGCDVLDLCDARAYARPVLALHERAVVKGVRIFTSCSAIAT